MTVSNAFTELKEAPLAVGAGLIVNVAGDQFARLKGLDKHLLIHEWVEGEWKAHAAAVTEVEVKLPQIACLLAQIHLCPPCCVSA